MPQAVAAFPQQLLNPLNLQPATGVEGFQGERGRGGKRGGSLLHHNPGGCVREMFTMKTDNQDELCASLFVGVCKHRQLLRSGSRDEVIIWIFAD